MKNGLPTDVALRRDAERLHRAVSDLVRIYHFRDRNRVCCYDISIGITRAGRRLYDRITADLVEQQRLIVQDIDPEVRQGVIAVIGRLASAAKS